MKRISARNDSRVRSNTAPAANKVNAATSAPHSLTQALLNSAAGLMGLPRLVDEHDARYDPNADQGLVFTKMEPPAEITELPETPLPMMDAVPHPTCITV